MRQQFDIPWSPTPKERPRVSMRGGTPRAYTPAKTRHAEAAIRYLLIEKKAKCYPAKVPLTVTLEFHMKRPASAAKRITHPCNKPDLDNLTKLIQDAAQDTLWRDDAQIVELYARKMFANGAGPMIRLIVEEIA